MRRLFSEMAILVMIIMVLSCATSSGIKFTPGTYQGTTPGFCGDITMEVTVSAGCILSIRVVSNNDTPEVSGLSISRSPGR